MKSKIKVKKVIKSVAFGKIPVGTEGVIVSVDKKLVYPYEVELPGGRRYFLMENEIEVIEST